MFFSGLKISLSIIMRRLKIEENIEKRESVSMEDFLLEKPATTSDEEEELVRRFKEGDSKALEILKESFQGWVLSIAKQYQNQGLKLHDLIESGNKGFAKGVDTFDKKKGHLFRSWITWSIRQSINEDLMAKK